MINPELDGKTHINIYSKSKSMLGQMLSNFYKYPIETDDGRFMSVEAYWYWLGIKECTEKEVLRDKYGWEAKKIGKELLRTKGKRFEENFEYKISKAIWYKFKRHSNLILSKYSNLQFEHYNYGGKVIDVKNKNL